jgi:site-specific recombinase XerD
MNSNVHERALVPAENSSQLGLRTVIGLWASATTGNGPRKTDLLRDKQSVIRSFFDFIQKAPVDVTPVDVRSWLTALEEKGIRPSTVYHHACQLSSFYNWAMREAETDVQIRSNPARLAKPKCPKPYQTESVKALSDEEVAKLVITVRAKADDGSIIGKRDLAMLLICLATGVRRNEVVSLKGRDVSVGGDSLIISYRAKGGDYRSREVAEPQVREAILAYLTAADRLSVLETERPLWTRHDRAGSPGAPLTSHCFARNLKNYAKAAGIDGFHLHRTRHTYARVVAEMTGDITATQNALDHQNRSTTRVYVQRIAVKRDLYSGAIARIWDRKE